MNLKFKKLKDRILKEQDKYIKDRLFNYITIPENFIIINHKYLKSDEVQEYLESGYLGNVKLMRRGIHTSIQHNDGLSYYRVKGLGSSVHLLSIDDLDNLLELCQRKIKRKKSQ